MFVIRRFTSTNPFIASSSALTGLPDRDASLIEIYEHISGTGVLINNTPCLYTLVHFYLVSTWIFGSKTVSETSSKMLPIALHIKKGINQKLSRRINSNFSYKNYTTLDGRWKQKKNTNKLSVVKKRNYFTNNPIHFITKHLECYQKQFLLFTDFVFNSFIRNNWFIY